MGAEPQDLSLAAESGCYCSDCTLERYDRVQAEIDAAVRHVLVERGLTPEQYEGMKELADLERSPADYDEPKTVIEEAAEIIEGERAETYGPALPSFMRIAGMWSAMLGIEITPVQVAEMMICLKISRNQSGYKRDSIVDVIGYAALADKVHNENEANWL